MSRMLPAIAAMAFFAASAAAQAEIEDFEFDVQTIDGEQMTQDDVKDKVVLVDFWGTWCGPCKQAIPELVRLYEKYHDKGLEIIGLNYENTASDAEALKLVRAFAEKAKIPYPLALGTEGIKAQIPKFGGYPTMLMFRRGLVLDDIKVGFRPGDGEKIEKWIEGALNSKAPEEKPEEPQLFLDLVDGGKLAVGGVDHYSLLVLLHPKRGLDEAASKALTALATKHGRLKLQLIGRGDLGALPQAKDTALVRTESLAKLRMGKAFPAYALLSPKGKTLYRDSGAGAATIEKLVTEIEDEITDPEKAAKKRAAAAALEKAEAEADAKAEAAEKAADQLEKKQPKKQPKQDDHKHDHKK